MADVTFDTGKANMNSRDMSLKGKILQGRLGKRVLQ